MPSTVGLNQTSRVPPGSDGLVSPVALAPPTPQGVGNYIEVPASSTSLVLGNPGAAGDYLDHLIVIPITTAAASITLIDGTTSYVVFNTGTLSDLKPFTIPFAMRSLTGPWKITTGANAICFAVGHFTGQN